MAAPKVPTIRIWCGVAYQGVDARDLGQRMFFLDCMTTDGEVTVVWDGHSYEEAIRAAERWERGGCVVIDDVD